MPTVYLTKKERFNAAHKLWVDDWDDVKNFEIFGKCANPNWHGHNYVLEITIKGEPDPITGFIMDAKVLSKVVQEEVLEYLDHMNLNLDVKFIPKGTQPTTENLVVLIWNQLESKLINCKLHKIRLQETETISAEYYG